MRKMFYVIGMMIMLMGLVSGLFAGDVREPLIIDVRTQREWNNGRLEGAILIPYNSITEKIGTASPDKSQKIYVYCRTGRRSRIAKEALEKLGYQEVVDLGSLENAAKTLQRKIIK